MTLSGLKDFVAAPWRHTKALTALSGTLFFLNVFLTPKPLVKLLFLQILFHCKFVVYFEIHNCSCVGIYHLFFFLNDCNYVSSRPTTVGKVVLLSGDCVDIYSTSDLFVCIFCFVFIFQNLF